MPAQPEIALTAAAPGGQPSPWAFQRWLLDSAAADQVFTLTPEQYSPVRTSNGTTWFDYDGDGGTTIRFGDGTFGASPQPGTVFTVTYRDRRRVGRQRAGRHDRQRRARPGAGTRGRSLHQPLPRHAAAPTRRRSQQVRDRAPRKFSAEPLRAVQAGDYVGRGSLAALGAAGGHLVPLDGQLAHRAHHRQPRGNRGAYDRPARVAHRPARPPAARRLRELRPPAGLRVDRPADHGLRAADRVRQRRRGGRAGRAAARASCPAGRPGSSTTSAGRSASRSSRARLLAAIQARHGRGRRDGRSNTESAACSRTGRRCRRRVTLAADRILRVDNDPSRPEAGSLRVIVEGGK